MLVKGQRHGIPNVWLGNGELDASRMDRLLAQAPCVSVGGETLRNDALFSALDESLTRLASRRAIPSIVGALRRDWIRQAGEQEQWPAILDGLLWSVWSWILMLPPAISLPFSTMS